MLHVFGEPPQMPQPYLTFFNLPFEPLESMRSFIHYPSIEQLMFTVLDQDTQSHRSGCSHSRKLAGVISGVVIQSLRAQGPGVGVGLGAVRVQWGGVRVRSKLLQERSRGCTWQVQPKQEGQLMQKHKGLTQWCSSEMWLGR